MWFAIAYGVGFLVVWLVAVRGISHGSRGWKWSWVNGEPTDLDAVLLGFFLGVVWPLALWATVFYWVLMWGAQGLVRLFRKTGLLAKDER